VEPAGAAIVKMGRVENPQHIIHHPGNGIQPYSTTMG